MADLRRHRLVFHGLRKSAVVFLLEAHCSDAETAAITSQSRDMVEHYCYAGEPEAVDSGRDPEVKRRRGTDPERRGGGVCATGPRS
jgi:hypothetical protein